jgi:hypothetical protein
MVDVLLLLFLLDVELFLSVFALGKGVTTHTVSRITPKLYKLGELSQDITHPLR